MNQTIQVEGERSLQDYNSPHQSMKLQFSVRHPNLSLGISAENWTPSAEWLQPVSNPGTFEKPFWQKSTYGQVVKVLDAPWVISMISVSY